MSKILFLGAAPHQCTAIRYARERGYTVFTCDNLPHNPGHGLAERAFNISALDYARITELASSLQVDAIVGYASEPCSLAAAHVADALSLPGPGSKVAHALADKALFRQLLREQGIQDVPFEVFETEEASQASRWCEERAFEVVIKPVDASGSKGVTVRPKPGRIEAALQLAFDASRSRRIIVEAFVPRLGAQVGGDGYFEDSRLVFACFGDSYAVPGGGQPDILSKTFPSTHDPASLAKLRELIEQSGRAAGLHRGPINFDAFIQPDAEPFLIEMAARNGGNMLPDLIARQAGVDLAGAAVECALNQEWRLPLPSEVEPRWHAYHMLHGVYAGCLKALQVGPELQPYVVEFRPYAIAGAAVAPFAKANDALGCVILRFESRAEMESIMPRLAKECRVELESLPC